MCRNWSIWPQTVVLPTSINMKYLLKCLKAVTLIIISLTQTTFLYLSLFLIRTIKVPAHWNSFMTRNIHGASPFVWCIVDCWNQRLTWINLYQLPITLHKTALSVQEYFKFSRWVTKMWHRSKSFVVKLQKCQRNVSPTFLPCSSLAAVFGILWEGAYHQIERHTHRLWHFLKIKAIIADQSWVAARKSLNWKSFS